MSIEYIECLDGGVIVHVVIPRREDPLAALAALDFDFGENGRPMGGREYRSSFRYQVFFPDAGSTPSFIDRWQQAFGPGARCHEAISCRVEQVADSASWAIEGGCVGCGASTGGDYCGGCVAALDAFAEREQAREDGAVVPELLAVGVLDLPSGERSSPVTLRTLEVWSDFWLLGSVAQSSVRVLRGGIRRLGPNHRRLVAEDDRGGRYSAPFGAAASDGTVDATHEFSSALNRSANHVVVDFMRGTDVLTRFALDTSRLAPLGNE